MESNSHKHWIPLLSRLRERPNLDKMALKEECITDHFPCINTHHYIHTFESSQELEILSVSTDGWV